MYRQAFLAVVLNLALLAGAQQKPAHAKSPAASSETAAPNMPSEATVNAFLQQTFGYEPDVTWKVESIKPAIAQGLTEVDVLIRNRQGSNINKLYVTADGKHALIGDIIPFGSHPFQAAREELKQKVTGPTRGPAEAPVTIVEFSDLQCPHCKEAQPSIDKLLTEDKNVRVVFQNFPLPAHDWAMKAAGYADCIARTNNDAFWKFVEGVYEAQSDITAAAADEKLTAVADKAGAKGSDVAACAAKPETTSRVQQSIALGKSLDVNSTPTLFINGREVPGGVPYEVLKKLVEFGAK
jgi:protein-disulfide isomerase